MFLNLLNKQKGFVFILTLKMDLSCWYVILHSLTWYIFRFQDNNVYKYVLHFVLYFYLFNHLFQMSHFYFWRHITNESTELCDFSNHQDYLVFRYFCTRVQIFFKFSFFNNFFKVFVILKVCFPTVYFRFEKNIVKSNITFWNPVNFHKLTC